jgi:hypothetical protein
VTLAVVGPIVMARDLLLLCLLFLGGCAAFTGVQRGLDLERQGPELVPSATHQLLNLPSPLLFTSLMIKPDSGKPWIILRRLARR